MRAGWRGEPFSGWWVARALVDPEVTAQYARGAERRRIAIALNLWFPGRDRQDMAPLSERRASRAAVRAAEMARRIAASAKAGRTGSTGQRGAGPK